MRIVSIIETYPNCWRVAYDGRVLGDSRGFDKNGALREARQIVADEQRWAARDGRPVELQLDHAIRLALPA
jgi:hypothetical protein